MGINTDLNVDPYYDDFSEAKQFNRILFKPAKAVQARELTQLQTILQKQVERFGSNVYKEGTVISGINITSRPDISYVKLNDTTGFTDPSVYNQTDSATFTATGNTTGLVAEIILGENGFQTQDPDLKTFFISYIGFDDTTVAGASATDVKQFSQGEVLSIKNSSGTILESVTVATVAAHAGKSFGVSCEEGVVYQKGHFIFVDNQFVIVSKYSNIPGASSVGFTIAENLINSNQDTTLLDNASGFNNENAPGADRLQLVPKLVTFATASEPEEFFALVRYVGGEAVRIRDRTEFNVIGDELARRTYEESGNYVTNGLKVTLEQDGSDSYAVVSPGKAYAFGRETINVSARKLLIDPTTLTQTKNNQYTGVQYGQYFTYAHAQASVLDDFAFDGTVYNLKNSGNTIIGTCSISNVTPGKIYAYNIRKNAGQENTAIAKIANTPITNSGTLYGVNSGGKIFDTGKGSINSISNVSFTRRMKQAVVGSSPITISATADFKPLPGSNIFAVDSSNQVCACSSQYINTDDLEVTITDNGSGVEFVYFDAIISGTAQDGLQELDIYVNTTYDLNGTGSFGVSNIASLGVPNAIQLLEVMDTGATPAVNITSKFKLVNNQKDHFYDHSYITLKAGETIAQNRALRVKVKALRRQSTLGSGYLTANSYSALSNRNLVKNFEGKNGISYDLINSFDFRPYKQPLSSYSLGVAGASTVTALSSAIVPGISPANNATIISNQSYFMSRIDSVVLDEFGDTIIYKGGEAENPSIPEISGMYALSNVYVPGNVTTITGNNPIRVVDVTNKNYTMKEIAGIEQKIDRLTDLVSLSLLETQTKSLFIPDANGLDRFKNGILVDSFKTLAVGDVADPDFGAAIDKSRTVATPSVTQFPVDLKVDSSTGANVYQDVVTLADTGSRVTVIDQPFATNFRNCVSNFYNYAGKASIDPPFDAGYDVIQNPAVNLEIDIATPLLDLVDNLQEVLPLTREQVDSITGAVVANGNLFSQTTTTTTTATELVVGDNQTTTSSVGNFVTDVTMSPYIQSREVKILVTGLRPNTRHYFFLDGTAINTHVYPGEVNPTVVGSATEYNVGEVEVKGTLGASVRTDTEGTLAAVFVIPEATFFVGERAIEIADVDQYSSLDSGKTSYTKAVYRAYNFEVSKSDLTQTTRTPTFDVERNVTTRSFTRQWRVDPIAQTFIVRPAQAEGASMSMISSVDVYFKSKSATVGATLELREVVNGYPSQSTLPFGRKHLRPSQINVSDTGATSTTFEFKNPVKLNVNKEYCFVVIPDANSPDFLIFTSKVGNADLATGTSITNDWGDGVLFTSTNDSAWKSYQDEDIKFALKRYQHQATAGSVDLSPNDVEFLTVTDTTLQFRNDELAYVKKNTSYACGVTDRTVTITGGSVFAVGDYILIEDDGNKFLSEIVAANDSASSLTLRTPYGTDITTSATASLTVAGKVSYFNKRKSDRVFLRLSSAKAGNFFVTGEILNGYRTGATTTISTVDNEPISYFQPQIFMSNSVRTSTDLTLYNGAAVDKSIPANGNVYNTNALRVINSTSNIVNPSLSDSNDFKIRVAMTNNGYQSATPIVDPDLSMLNAYKYKISDSGTSTSSWVTREVTLQEQLDANGLRVYLSGYRPAGTYVDVYARFVYPTDIEVQSNWIKLANSNEDMYSNPSNTLDYREYQYDLSSETNEFSSFQLKFELRHATTTEINALDLVSAFPSVTRSTTAGNFVIGTTYRITSLGSTTQAQWNTAAGTSGVTYSVGDTFTASGPGQGNGTANSSIVSPAENLFPHIFDYRAIALT